VFSQIDIESFGSFKDLVWRKSLKDPGNTVQNFKRLNVIYGRNYSGKTTLSRIFRALETGRIPPNYTNPVFTVYGDKGSVTQANIGSHGYDIRVYNRDFVGDNLSFLANQANGEIKTFAIVGEKNKEIDDAITAIQAKLGSAEQKAGLRYDEEVKRKKRDQAKFSHKSASDALEEKLRSHANEKIKKNRTYGTAVYNIDSIKKDIHSVQKPDFSSLTTEEQASRVNILKQEALPDIKGTVSISLKIDSIKMAAEELLSRSVKPTQAIQELLSEAALQAWVKQGVTLHKEKRDTCAFCRQDLPHDIWKTLDAHFSKESSDLDLSIGTCLVSIDSEIQAIPDFMTLSGDMFYADERVEFEKRKSELAELLKSYRNDLEALRAALLGRKNSIFNTVPMPALKSDSVSIQHCSDAINSLISRNNGRTSTLEKDKSAARAALRLTDVASFISDIGYSSELTRISDLKQKASDATSEHAVVDEDVRKLEAEIAELQGRQKDERKGAERVNALLTHFFGHGGIKLEAKEAADKTAVKFEITRDGKSAYNLSEGECSLIAFCYFMAKLEEPGSKGKDLIIYIDDPISSLDGNHIFFMFSLIESLIAKPVKNADGSNSYRYSQLFISTHNLDFLKYLKKISMPNEKNHGGNQHFLIERGEANSNIQLMPSYLKDYITEFNYLFHQIYKCRDAQLAKTSHEPFYSFGNNLRKFLEAFLFYKYPHHDDKNDSLERMKKFFGEDDASVALANRLNNELSHLEAVFDRSMKPIEIPEIPKLANFVLDKIYASDPDQYNSLLRSIGEPERTQ